MGGDVMDRISEIKHITVKRGKGGGVKREGRARRCGLHSLPRPTTPPCFLFVVVVGFFCVCVFFFCVFFFGGEKGGGGGIVA